MFMTMPNLERAVPVGMAPTGCRFWRVAELSVNIPWYAVTLESADGEWVAIRHLLVADDRDVLGLIGNAGTEPVLALKQMVTAPHDMASQAWEARDILRVWTGPAAMSGTPEGVLFEDAAGRFSNGLGPVLKPAASDLTLVFQLPHGPPMV